MTGPYPATPPAVAIVGVSGRFPGAPDVASFWRLVRDGVDAITFFSDDALLASGESPERLADPGYVRAWGRLDGIDQFDASFFGMSPRDAAVFDPQHRLFLECAWHAFESAGCVGEQFPGRVGVFGACGAAEYMMYNLVRNRQVMETVGAWLVRHNGNDSNFLATRVSYELNLSGPSLSVQTACSSSLVAVHLACQSLLSGECDMALAGGATVYPEQNRGYLYKEGEILSPDGHCRAFDARSAGTVMASAVGCVVLKRLEDAIRDRDRVLAIVRGSAINNDGSEKVGYLAPSVSGQARVVREALAVAGVSPEDVTYVEAHGTGTLIGDPIEIAALTQAFRDGTDRAQYCALGSLKTNIGHTGEAAGICGLIKTVLALVHRQIPPSLHFETANPQIDFASSPFFVNTRLREWKVPEGQPRIAGVTALGAGGTNAHVLLEQGPEPTPSPPARAYQLLVVSAKTASALELATQNLATHLRALPEAPLADVASTLLSGRKGFGHRRAVAARSASEAAALLEGADPKRVATHHHKHDPPRVAFLFPGGGAQHARMGADLYEAEPAYREAFDACLAHLDPALRADVRSLVFARTEDVPQASARLEAPSRGLPALFATEYALAKLLESWGVTPSAMIGHSAGEYAAACIAGVVTPRDAITLVATRGALFERLPEGAMLSIALPEEQARTRMGPELSFAAVNGPSMCVASGPVAAIALLEATLEQSGVECTRVHIRVAAHSAMLDPILDEFAAVCRRIRFEAPRIPFVSNLTGTWIEESEARDPMYWVRHLRSTVRFGQGAETLLSSAPRALIEIGPGRALSSLARQQKTKAVTITPTLRHPLEEGSDEASLLLAVGRLWTAGVALDAERLFGPGRRKVDLPLYPFERQRYWIDADPASAAEAPKVALAKRHDIAEWFYAPAWSPAAAPAEPDASGESRTTIVLTDRSPLATAIVAALRRRSREVIVVAAGERFTRHGADDYELAPGRRADYDALATELRERGVRIGSLLHLWGLAPRPRAAVLGRLGWDPLGAYPASAITYHYALLFFAQAFAAEAEAMRIIAVSSHMQAAPGDDEIHPEKAMLLGALKVIPREYPGIVCTSVDIDDPGAYAKRGHIARVPGAPGAPPSAEAGLERILREVLDERPHASEVALRGPSRWIRRFEALRLEPAPSPASWLRQGGVYLVTGGLGGIGLTVAEHLAAAVQARLVLVSRTPLPPEDAHDSWLAGRGPDDEVSQRISRIRAMRARGADIMTAAADVTDLESMAAVVQDARRRYGTIHGVLHTAGVLEDELIALRPGLAESVVLDAKVKGALVLDTLFARAPLDVFVLFSSVSAILGLPGQADYTAANAFLDAFAHARSAARPGERTISIDWNAWQDVGMLARRLRRDESVASRAERSSSTRLSGGHPLLAEIVRDVDGITVFRTPLHRAECWLLSEHVVRGGEAVLPGTGFLEIARAALEAGGKTPASAAIELRDVLFMTPFVVPRHEPRALHVRIEREREGTFAIYGEAENDVFVSGKAAYVAAPPAAHVDLGAIRARCTVQAQGVGGFLDQHFMDFGPRWGNVRRIHRGHGEALLDLQLPDAFVADLTTFRLHPALLDMATGGAQTLIPGFEPETAFYVPFSYGRLVLRRPLTPSMSSHVRLRDATARDSAIFDVTLYDVSGDEIATVEGFVMRRLRGGLGARSPASTHPPKERRSTTTNAGQESALREGMKPREGIEALDRILTSAPSPQVVACSVDLHHWLERIAREARGVVSTPAANAEGDGALFARPALSAAYVAPRDDVERELAGMWRELLGAREIGVHDDFFELGGQSLVAVRLFHRIGKKYGVELPMATLFQAPTIADCAAVLRARLGRPAEIETAESSPAERAPSEPPRSVPHFRALVTLQHGSGQLLPFFCVHGAGGNVLKFRDLSRAMSHAQPLYGLQAYGVDGITPPHATIEQMAQAYLAEIREVQPHGPYLLGGYSGGGVVAFEMVQRLAEVGESVRLLALLDTPNPQMPIRRVTRLSVLLGDGLRTRAARAAAAGMPYIIQGLKRQRERTAELTRRTRDEQTIADLRARREPIPFALRELHLVRNFERAAAQYHPRPWDGHAVLFRAAEVDFLFADGGPTYGWDDVISGGIEVVEVPGGHHTLVVGANAEVLARALGRAIERVQIEVATRRSS